MRAVAGRNTREQCCFVLGRVVYDVTPFMHRHPGGATSLLLFGGTDASSAFAEIPHSEQAHRYMRSLAVPELHLPDEGWPARLGRTLDGEPLPSRSPTSVRIVDLARTHLSPYLAGLSYSLSEQLAGIREAGYKYQRRAGDVPDELRSLLGRLRWASNA